MILIIHTGLSTFVKKDIQYLETCDKVLDHRYHNSKRLISNLFEQFKLLLWLTRHIGKSTLVYIWFAGYHSMLPVLYARILRRKSVLVLGGYDVAHIPELNYGSFSHPIRKVFTKYSLAFCSEPIAVSRYVAREAEKRVKNRNVTIIYNGVDFDTTEDIGQKEDIFLTVAICDTLKRFRLKGIDLFLDVAQSFPEHQFIIVGISPKVQVFFSDIPSNVQVFPKLPRGELEILYKKSKFYCQFSMVESFGLALAEAMFHGCIPIVTRVGGMPEIVGDTGIYIDHGKNESIRQTINNVINNSWDVEKIRNRIVTRFSIEKRGKKLVKLVNQSLPQGY